MANQNRRCGTSGGPDWAALVRRTRSKLLSTEIIQPRIVSDHLAITRYAGVRPANACNPLRRNIRAFFTHVFGNHDNR